MQIKETLDSLEHHERQSVYPALKALLENRIFEKLAQAEIARLVQDRLDFEDNESIVDEVRVTRQTNRILTELDKSIREYLEGTEYEVS